MTSSTNDPSSPPSGSILPNGPWASCPVLLEAKSVLDKAHNLRRALRHLSRSTQSCLACPQKSICPSMRNIDHSVDLALQQLTRELGLDQE